MDEAQVTDLLDHISDALYAVDKYWCFTYLNHTAAMQLGRNRDDLLGKNIWEEWPHAVGSDAYNHLLGAMEERRAVTFEYVSPTLHRAFDVRAHPYAGGLAVYQSDSTARKQAQTERERLFTELEESRRLLQRIVETSPDVLYIADLDARRTTYINARSTQVFGYTSDELLALGDRFAATLWHPDDLAGLPAHRRKLFGLADGEIYESEHRTLRPDGTYSWLRTHTSVFARTDDGQVRQIIGVIQDVTARKQAEERMAYHAHVLEHVHDAIVAADERLVVTAWNRAAEQMYGWTAEEALGRDIRDVVRSDFDPEERAAGYRVLAETGLYRAEAVHHRKDGSPIHIEGSIVALRDAAERMTGYVYVYRDITERKRAEEALRRVHDDLEAKVAERTRELAEANAVLRLENTERQRAEESARLAKAQAERRAREAEEAQSMLKTILDRANEGITMAGGPPDFPIILNNKYASEMLGRAPNTMLKDVPRHHLSR